MTNALRLMGRPRGLVPLCIAVPLALSGGCGPAGGPRSDPSTLSIAYCCGDDVLNPMMDTNARMLVFLPLARYDERGELEGRLAKRWEHDDDYRVWVFHLRTDVVWHDGVPVTARDVVFTIRLWSHPDVGWYGAAGVEDARAPDDSTVVIRYREPTDPLTIIPWLVYYPKHLLEDLDPVGFYDWPFWSRPVGDGPYRFSRATPATSMEFEANDRHFEGRPSIDRIVLRFVAGAGSTELLGGGVDILTEVAPRQAAELAEDPRFRAYYSMSTGTSLAVYWNQGVPLLSDARVRQALGLAVDRSELRAILGFPAEIPILDGPVSLRQLARRRTPEPAAYDPAEAARRLALAGWVDTDGDGILDRDGEPLRLTLLVPSTPPHSEIAIPLQAMLRRVGVDLEVQSLEGGTVFQRTENGDFDAAVRSTGNPLDWLERYFGRGSRLGYDGAEAHDLIGRLATVADPDGREALLARLTEIFRRDAPALFLFPTAEFVVARQEVAGLSSPWRAQPALYADELSLVHDSR